MSDYQSSFEGGSGQVGTLLLPDFSNDWEVQDMERLLLKLGRYVVGLLRLGMGFVGN